MIYNFHITRAFGTIKPVKNTTRGLLLGRKDHVYPIEPYSRQTLIKGQKNPNKIAELNVLKRNKCQLITYVAIVGARSVHHGIFIMGQMSGLESSALSKLATNP